MTKEKLTEKAPLNALRAFTLTAKLGSIKLAAEALGVSHSAVSQQLKILNNRVKTALLTREAGSLQLTAAGQALYAGLAPAFSSIEQTLAQVSLLHEQQQFTLSLPPQCSALAQHLADYQLKHPSPRLLLEFNSTDSDATIVLSEQKPKHSELLLQNSLLLIGNPSIAQPDLKKPDNKQRFIFINTASNKQQWSDWFAAGMMHKPNSSQWLQAKNLAEAKQIALSMNTIILCSHWEILNELLTGSFVTASKQTLALKNAIYLQINHSPLPAPQNLVKYLYQKLN